LSGFDQQMEEHQKKWRNKPGNVSSSEQGWQNGKQYPWILPPALWEEGLWPRIRSGSARSLPAYLDEYRIQKHVGVNNLKSSWTLCANLYFPFRCSTDGRALLAGFLAEKVHPSIKSVEGVELEYAGRGDLHPSVLLGEAGGKKGAGQTSPDVAFLVNQGNGLILTENKFTEHSFYPCSALKKKGSPGKPVNPDPTRCKQPLAVLNNPTGQCHQMAWGRKYWKHLQPCARREVLATLSRCPAATAGYQLFRQQALGEGIATTSKYELVVSCLAVDERNVTLKKCLTSTGMADAWEWGKLFEGKALFRVFFHQDWVAWVRKRGDPEEWRGWLNWVTERYCFAP